jgi:hypothetical protein
VSTILVDAAFVLTILGLYALTCWIVSFFARRGAPE